MPRRAVAIYRRGKYWLAWDEKADGSRRSPYLAIFWYEIESRRVRSTSTGETTEEAGMIALDRRYLADRGEAVAFCQACGQSVARADAYFLTDAIADYRLEIGDARASGDSIAARLKHVVDYLEAVGLTAISCAEATAPLFAERFREWSRAQPAVWRNKAGAVTVSRPRSPATTEESIVQLGAVLNHAVNARRSDARPLFKPLGRKQVSQARRVRIEEPVLADMLAYAAEPKRRRGALHAFLVAEICTLARPDAIVDISTAPARRQWWPGSRTLDLNQAGRVQTKKYRSLLPVVPLLTGWLDATHADADVDDPQRRTGHWLVNYYGRGVRDVESAWEAMLVALRLPLEREWRPYLLRHSLATLMRAAGAPKWDLAGFMGHDGGSTTEIYAIDDRFPRVTVAIEALIADLEGRVPGALHRTRTGTASNVVSIRSAAMPSG